MYDYFYQNENEQYLFLQMPLLLIKDEKFRGLSDGAKILYSLFLNRTSLSAKNGWLDDQGRVYIIYTIEEVMSDLNCWENKAVKVMKELKDIGLIKTIRRGLGKPNIIYVMNFSTNLKYKKKEPQNPENTVNCENYNSENVKNTGKETFKNAVQSLPETQCIYINTKKDLHNYKYNDSNHIESNQSTANIQQSNISMSKPDEIRFDKIPTQQIRTTVTEKDTDSGKKRKNKESPKNATATENSQAFKEPPKSKYSLSDIEEIIKGNIYYDHILIDRPDYKEMLDGVLHVIVSTIMTDYRDGYVRMGKENVPAEVVRSVFFKLTRDDVEYFIDNFNRQVKPAIKLTPYIRTSLYRNHGTNDFYWKNRFNVDVPPIAVGRM